MAVTLSVHNMQLRNIGRATCVVSPTNPTLRFCAPAVKRHPGQRADILNQSPEVPSHLPLNH